MDSLIWSGRFVLDMLCAQEVRSAWLGVLGAAAASPELCYLHVQPQVPRAGLLLLGTLGCMKSAAGVIAKHEV